MNQAIRNSTSNKAMLLLAFMWVAYFLNYCDRQAITAMFPRLRSDLNMTDVQLGLVSAIFLWVYGCGCPLAGQLADKVSKRWLVVISLALWSIVTAATGLAPTAFVLLALRAAMGISEALYMPAAVSLTANAFSEEKRSRAVATLTTAQLVGIVFGSWFGGKMADLGLWRYAFLILGVVGLLYALPYFLFLRNLPEPPITAKSQGSRIAAYELFQVPSYIILCIVFSAYLFGQWLLYGWFPTFLSKKFEMSQADAALNATLFLQSAAFIGLISGGFLADRLLAITKASRLWLITATLVLCAPCLHMIGQAESIALTRIAAAGFGLFSGFLIGNIFPAAFEVVPADTRASAVGFLNFFGAMVSGVASLMGGYWSKVGIDRLLTYTSLMYIAAALLLILTIRFLFPKDYLRVH